MLLLNRIGSGMSDRQLMIFSAECCRGIDEAYLSEESRNVIRVIEAQIAGEKPIVSPSDALAALDFEIFDSTLNSNLMSSAISPCVSDLLRKSP